MRFWVVIVSFLERKEIRVKEVRGLTLANDSLNITSFVSYLIFAIFVTLRHSNNKKTTTM